MVLQGEKHTMKLGFKIWVLVFTLLFAFLAIAPWKIFNSGVLISSVTSNSTAFEQGLRPNQIIKFIDGEKVSNLADYTKIISSKFTSNQTLKTTIQTKDSEFILFSNKAPEITVSELPTTNIKTGLDLSGGARALVKAKNIELSSSQLSDLISITENRFNTYGIADVRVISVKDLSGKNYMEISIAGATPKDLQELVSKQGKFEAKIGNETVFIGGEKDITAVCRNDASCARIEICDTTEGGYYCKFSFSITLSQQAAENHANITKDLEINSTAQGNYLSKKIDLYLDDNLVDSLLIGEDLKGTVTTQISISGSGQGTTQVEAYDAAKESMKKLQTILLTGSLPFQLEIVKLDTISPNLGKEFLKNITLLALFVFVVISIILFAKYRNIKITLAVILTMFSEAFVTLGIAALIKWNLDAPSIAGIIAGMGTGVNDQIVILDESVSNLNLGIKERIKRALFIILGAFFTIFAAMLPLFWAGAGMLKGFALTTLIGVSVGILITRPAFAEIIKRIGE